MQFADGPKVNDHCPTWWWGIQLRWSDHPVFQLRRCGLCCVGDLQRGQPQNSAECQKVPAFQWCCCRPSGLANFSQNCPASALFIVHGAPISAQFRKLLLDIHQKSILQVSQSLQQHLSDRTYQLRVRRNNLESKLRSEIQKGMSTKASCSFSVKLDWKQFQGEKTQKSPQWSQSPAWWVVRCQTEARQPLLLCDIHRVCAGCAVTIPYRKDQVQRVYLHLPPLKNINKRFSI